MARKCMLFLAAGFLFVGIFLLLFPERKAFRRQKEEEELAEAFIRDEIPTLASNKEETSRNQRNANHKSENISHFEEMTSASSEEEPGGSEVQDEVYYERNGILYTPDYAEGYLQCVLTVPKEEISICRGVYAGTWEEIDHDLEIWMVTAARPDYILGETHYVIYGHNHPVQNLSFNRLPKIKAGDGFTLTAEDRIYIYEVEEIKALSREEVAREIADNFTLPKEKCYIVTCGRGKYRGLDLVVEGSLKETRGKRE